MSPRLGEITTLDQLREATRLQMRVFLAEKEPLHALVYPSSDPPTESEIDRIATEIWTKQAKERAAGADSRIWEVRDDADGGLMAAARWVFYPQGSKIAYEAPVVNGPDIETRDEQEAAARLAYLKFCYDKCLTPRVEQCKDPHAMLELCFTDPSRRRQGAAKLLMEAGIRRADELGLPCFVEAVGNGSKLYERYGFELRARLVAKPAGGCWEGRAGWNGCALDWMRRPALHHEPDT